MASGCAKSGCGCLSGVVALFAVIGVVGAWNEGKWEVVFIGAIICFVAAKVAIQCTDGSPTDEQIARAKSLGMLVDKHEMTRSELEELLHELETITSPDDEELK